MRTVNLNPIALGLTDVLSPPGTKFAESFFYAPVA